MAIRTVRLIDTIPRPAKSSGLRAAVMIASALVANDESFEVGAECGCLAAPESGVIQKAKVNVIQIPTQL